MVQTTRAQRVKLKELWEQADTNPAKAEFIRSYPFKPDSTLLPKGKGSYREFRKSVMPGFGYIGIMWNGMYIGIETDGYTHS